MVFPTLDHAREFYLTYAKASGFCIRKGGEYVIGGVIRSKYFTCSKEGHKPFKRYDTAEDHSTNGKKKLIKKRKTPTSRCDCGARIRLNFVDADGSYTLESFVEEHNHSLVSAEDIHLIRANRKLTISQQNMLCELADINLGPIKAFHVMRTKYGGFEHVGATPVECKNFRRDLNSFIGEYDAEMIVRRLLDKKTFMSDYSFEHSVDCDGNLTGLFWADEECKRNYIAFGDIVGFDATFNTNK